MKMEADKGGEATEADSGRSNSTQVAQFRKLPGGKIMAEPQEKYYDRR